MPTPSLPILLAAGLVVGAGTGVALERADVLSPLGEPEEEAVAEAAVGGRRIGVFDCPEGTIVADLVAGDRVLATGRTDDGSWIEIRSPLDLDDRVWVGTAALVGDRDLDDLPTSECAVEATTTTSSSTTSSTSSTTSSTSSTTTTTAPPDDTTTTTDPGGRPPGLADAASSEGTIVTSSANNPTTCFQSPEPGLPLISTISVRAVDDRPGLQVQMSYVTVAGGATLSNGSLSVGAPSGDVYSAQLGPLPAAAASQSTGTLARVTITAIDAGGQRATAIVELEVERCLQ